MVLVVLVLMLVLMVMVMQQAPVAIVCKFGHEGGLVEGTAWAQCELCLVCSEVQVGGKDEEHEVDGCVQHQGALERALQVVPTPQQGRLSDRTGSFS